MIGLIICGHGHFASGITSSLKLIAGKQQALTYVDFYEGMSPEELTNKLIEKIDELNSLENIIILTDIPGGTPFNRAVLLSNDKIRVISGINLPALLESIYNREESIDTFVKLVMNAGKEGFKNFHKIT